MGPLLASRATMRALLGLLVAASTACAFGFGATAGLTVDTRGRVGVDVKGFANMGFQGAGKWDIRTPEAERRLSVAIFPPGYFPLPEIGVHVTFNPPSIAFDGALIYNVTWLPDRGTGYSGTAGARLFVRYPAGRDGTVTAGFFGSLAAVAITGAPTTRDDYSHCYLLPHNTGFGPEIEAGMLHGDHGWFGQFLAGAAYRTLYGEDAWSEDASSLDCSDIH